MVLVGNTSIFFMLKAYRMIALYVAVCKIQLPTYMLVSTVAQEASISTQKRTQEDKLYTGKDAYKERSHLFPKLYAHSKTEATMPIVVNTSYLCSL